MKFFDEAIPFLFKRGAGGAQGGVGGAGYLVNLPTSPSTKAVK